MSTRMNRRKLLQAAGLALSAGAAATAQSRAASRQPVMCLFSKPLGRRKAGELPDMLGALGIGAVDLTCRPGGHVMPERVRDDLPRAVEAFKASGIAVPMITTGITDAHQDHAESIIQTAAAAGIRFIKLGYYVYADQARILPTLNEVKPRLRDLAALCRQHGVTAGFHNHSGRYVGAPLWDLWQLLQDLPAESIGAYFDLGHATVEGGAGGWSIGLDLLAPRVVMLAVKDMKWIRTARGWEADWGPLGQGMVPWKAGLARLRKTGFAGPISLHIEYGDESRGPAAEQAALANIRRDWETLRAWLEAAGLL